LCDGSNSIHSIANSVGILESDLIELIATLDSAALVTFEKITTRSFYLRCSSMIGTQNSQSGIN
jgi:hypothetical protein